MKISLGCEEQKQIGAGICSPDPCQFSEPLFEGQQVDSQRIAVPLASFIVKTKNEYTWIHNIEVTRRAHVNSVPRHLQLASTSAISSSTLQSQAAMIEKYFDF